MGLCVLGCMKSFLKYKSSIIKKELKFWFKQSQIQAKLQNHRGPMKVLQF